MKTKSEAQMYLEQVAKLNAMIENKTAEIAQWRCVALCVTSHSDGGDRVQSSGNQQKMADAIERVIDLEREIAALVDGLINTKLEIVSTIERLNAVEYDVLHKRYIQELSFDEIAATKGKSKTWATTVHGRAMQSLNAILREKNVTK